MTPILRTSLILSSMALVLACTGAATEKAFAEYSSAYSQAYQGFTGLELRAVQGKIWDLGDAGKPFQPQFEALEKRHSELNDRLVEANAMAAEGKAATKPETVRAATELLAKVKVQTDALAGDLHTLEAALKTASQSAANPDDGNAHPSAEAPAP